MATIEVSENVTEVIEEDQKSEKAEEVVQKAASEREARGRRHSKTRGVNGLRATGI